MDASDVARIIFGSIFVLLVPGLAWSYVFFRSGKIDWIERVALSFGLSVALVPLTVFWFNWVFGVKITLLNTTLLVVAITAVALLWLYARRRGWSVRLADKLKLLPGFSRSRRH